MTTQYYIFTSEMLNGEGHYCVFLNSDKQIGPKLKELGLSYYSFSEFAKKKIKSLKETGAKSIESLVTIKNKKLIEIGGEE